MDVLIISGHYSSGRGDSLRHKDQFRLKVDGVTMNVQNLTAYFRNGRVFHDAAKRRLVEERRPYRQLYWSGLHLMNLMLSHDLETEIIHCHDASDHSRLEIYQQNPKIVVISTTFMNIDAVRSVVEDVRQHLPEVYVVIGGAYVRYSYLVWQRLNDPIYQALDVRNRYFFTMEEPLEGIDAFVFDQHGELTLMALAKAVQAGEKPTEMANTVVPSPSGLGFLFNAEQPEEYHIEDHRIQWSRMPRNCLHSIVPFQNTYGCPFKCSFCNFSLTRVHKKTMSGLMDELTELASRDVVQTVWFTDDNFFLNERLIMNFCNEYIEAGAPFEWITFVRASSITPASAKLLKEARCSLLLLGIESGSQTILNNIEKHDTVEHYMEAIELLVKNDIDLELSFIFGLPGENEQTVSETLDFINRIPISPTQVSYIYMFAFNVLPLSPVFEKAQRDRWGIVGNFDQWHHSTMASHEVPDVLRSVAGSVKTAFFNYLDSPLGRSKESLVAVMHKREELGRLIIREGKEHPDAARLWDELEELVMGDGVGALGEQALRSVG